MFEVLFVPKPDHTAKMSRLSKKQINCLCGVFVDIVTSAFPSAQRYNAQCNLSGNFLIKVLGVSPHSGASCQIFTQKISNTLVMLGLNELYEIRQVSNQIEMGDTVFSPESKMESHFSETMLNSFDKSETKIPESFLCPITGRIMHDPAYLTTNPKINYEYSALTKWVLENETDPATRKKISTPGIINNSELRKRISSFVIDVVLNRPVDHYFTSDKKDASVQCSLASNTLSLFGSVKLEHEFYTLAAKALRRLAHQNDVASAEKLLAQYGVENIINLQDENPSSRKTALHIAIAQCNTEMARLLVANGARADIEDASKETAHSIADKNGNTEIKNILDSCVENQMKLK